MAMGTLSRDKSNSRELVTEILDEAFWWGTLRLVVEFLHTKAVERVRVEFGFVLDRDIAGKQQGRDEIVQLADLEGFIRAGIDEGTIERAGSSDFLFSPLGTGLTFMLCNDADLHFASTEPLLLAELAGVLRGGGIRVYDDGRFV
jgi:hypothetical protein